MHPAAAPGRREALAEVLKSAGIDAYLASASDSLLFFGGFSESGYERLLALAVLADGRAGLVCPALTAAQAQRAGAPIWDAWTDGEDAPFLLAQRLKGASKVAVDGGFRADHLLELQRHLPDAEFISGEGLRSQVTRVKGPVELEGLRRAGAMADAAFLAVLPLLRAGITERQLAGLLGAAMEEQGGTPTFATVGFGAGSAEPHHHTSSEALQPGQVVLMDFGCSWEGWQSDITRIAALGDPGEEAHRIYQVVLAAHLAGRDAIRPGVQMQEIDRAARAVIERAGFGPQFSHRLGHGLGLSIHEEPNVCEGVDLAVEPGFVFSIEPGIYLEGRFGIRIENIVAATADSHESLNAEPPAGIVVLAG